MVFDLNQLKIIALTYIQTDHFSCTVGESEKYNTGVKLDSQGSTVYTWTVRAVQLDSQGSTVYSWIVGQYMYTVGQLCSLVMKTVNLYIQAATLELVKKHLLV